MIGYQVVVDMDASSTERILTYLNAALSPAGFATFLQETVGPYLEQRIKARFSGEGDDVVGPWAPLSPATIAVRTDQGYGAGPINNRTGAMERFLEGHNWSIQSGADITVLQLPGFDVGGKTGKKIKTAQMGDGASNTQPRPVLGMNEADLSYIVSTMAFWISAGAV